MKGNYKVEGNHRGECHVEPGTECALRTPAGRYPTQRERLRGGTVAFGQGTQLNHSDPTGMFPLHFPSSLVLSSLANRKKDT